MKKIWIAAVLFALIFSGGILYNNYVSGETDKMIFLADKAYETGVENPEECIKILGEIDEKLEKMSALLCAFLDREIINDVKDEIVLTQGLADTGSDEVKGCVLKLKEKIRHIKNSAEIKLKYIL